MNKEAQDYPLKRKTYPIEEIRVAPVLERPATAAAQFLENLVSRINTHVYGVATVDLLREIEDHKSTHSGSELLQSLIRGEREVDEYYAATIIEHLERGGSVMFLSNHESHVDHALLLHHIARPLKRHIQDLTYYWVAGNKLFTDFYRRILSPQEMHTYRHDIKKSLKDRIKYAFEGTVVRLMAKHYKMNMIPIFQVDRKGSREFMKHVYIPNVRDSLDVFEEHMNKPHSLGCFFLEGGRSNDGVVRQAASGLHKMIRDEKIHNHIMYVPLGIIGSKDVLSKNFTIDVTKDVELAMGKPFFASEVQRDAQEFDLEIKDILMVRIIETIPQKKWGFYKKSKFKNYRKSRNMIV